MGNWRFSKSKGKKCQLLMFFLPNFEKNNHEKTCIWCTMCICCEIRKIGQRQIGVKIISVVILFYVLLHNRFNDFNSFELDMLLLVVA